MATNKKLPVGQNQHTLDRGKMAERWRAVAEYYREHGAPATAKQFNISRARVYQILDTLKGK